MRRSIWIWVAALSAIGCAQWPQADQTWAFTSPHDDFRTGALLDLRSLNEKVAGDAGFVRANAAGDFELGNGKPARFWAIVSDVGREVPYTKRPLWEEAKQDLALHAKFLAKRGVNLVRLHSQQSPDLQNQKGAKITDNNPHERDWIWRAVAAYKKEGIYTVISPYWGVPMKFAQDWNYPGGPNQSALGLLFFEPKLQAAYKSWLKQLFAEKNPNTGIPLAQDPSVAVIQLQNEDSLLFWTVNNIQGEPRRILQTKFGEWLKSKYGSIQAASARWDGNKQAGDNFAAGLVDFANIWEMTQPRTGGFATRLTDQTEFWAETMYKFNADIEKVLRTELGCKQLINAGNWRTADPIRLNDIERWSYTANQVDAKNHYFGGVHKGPNEGWAVQNGDKFTSITALLDPKSLPVSVKQTTGRPMMVTESAWVFPNGYASEGPLLVSAYSSLNGLDAYCWFATGTEQWTPPQSANGYNPGQQKWLCANPDMVGGFPAAALMFRNGYVKRGAPAVIENRALADLWARKTPIIQEEASFDPNRDTGDIASRSSIKTGVDPLAFLVGPVQVAFGADPGQSKVMDLAAYINRQTGVTKSNTGELELNSQKGYATVNAPCAQGVSALFANQNSFALKDVTFHSRNAYGSALAVSMDGQPLATSAKILVQYQTQSRPTGWAETETEIKLDGGETVKGLEVKNYGKAPWQVVSAKLEVTIKNQNLKTVTVLDPNGYPTGTVPLTTVSGGVKFNFPSGALYVVLQ
jgi:hypothetical protein